MYMAIVCYPVSHDNFPDVLQQIPNGTSASESIEKFNKAVDDSVESLAIDGKVFGMEESEYVDALKQILYSAMTISSTTVLAKTDDGWIDVGESGYDIKKGKIACLEPFKDYYNEGVYPPNSNDQGEGYSGGQSGNYTGQGENYNNKENQGYNSNNNNYEEKQGFDSGNNQIYNSEDNQGYNSGNNQEYNSGNNQGYGLGNIQGFGSGNIQNQNNQMNNPPQ